MFPKKIYIDFLERVLDNQKDENTRYANHYSRVLKHRLQHDFQYSDTQLDQAKKSLIKSGYLGESRFVYVYATENGKKYLQKYAEFCLLPSYQKVIYFIKEYVKPIFWIIMSGLSLFLLIHQLLH